MADNVLITPGAGDTIAADEISGVKHQRVKVEFGVDGSATEVSSANPLPVDVISGADVVVDSNNTTTSTLTAGSTYTGTATDISEYAQVNVEIFGRPGTIAGDGSNAKASLYLEFSPNATNWDISIPFLIRDPSLVIPIPLINVGKYFRVRYLNDGGTAAIASLSPPGESATSAVAQTSFRLTTQLLPTATKELSRTLDQGISGSDPATLVRAVLAGRNPSNVVTNLPANGLSMTNNSSSTLTSGSTYTGTYEDREGYTGLSILVATDQLSASNGLVIQYSDTAAGTVVRATDIFTFDAAALANGYMFVTASFKSKYFRVKYTNGGSNQTIFYLETNLLTSPTEQQQQQIEALLTAETDGVINRSILNAKDPSSATYANITRSTTASNITGLHVAVAKHEVATPILALTSWVTNQAAIASTSAAVNVIPSPTTGRKTFIVKALSTNTKTVFIGPNNSVTTGNGFELAAGESIALEVDTTTSVWVIGTTAASQTLCYVEITGT